MKATVCPRCDRSIALDDREVTLDGRTYHRDCGFIEASVKGFHHLRASHKWEVGVCIGEYNTLPLHPPSMRVCQEAGLLHCENDGSLLTAAVFGALKHWYRPAGVNPAKAPRTCDGWNIDRIMRRLIGMLEATTLAYDHMEHQNVNESIRSWVHDIAGVKYDPQFLIPGGLVEVAQWAALCCNLALKTLYAIHNPAAPKKLFSKMRHDMSKAWDGLDGERGNLIGIMRAMPMFPLEDVDDELVRRMLSESADFDELRWGSESNPYPFTVSATTHLRLAWAAYLRCHDIVEYEPITPQLHAYIRDNRTNAAQTDRSAVRKLNRPATSELLDPKGQQGQLINESHIMPDWLSLAKEIPEIGWGNDLFKSNYGVLHRESGAYAGGSTFYVLQRWAMQERVATRRFVQASHKTSLGETNGLAWMLSGRLECISGNYALSAHVIHMKSVDGVPAYFHFSGELTLYAQAAVFVCELAIKWLYSLSHPDAPLSVYKGMGHDGHDVLEAWKHIPEHHDEILKTFHALPLFQSDGDLNEREHVSSERMHELLGRFRTTYSDARYGTTDPAKERKGVQLDYRICLHLAWAVYLYGMMNLPPIND